MQWLSNLKTGYKLGLGISLCFVLVFVITVISLSRMSRINQDADRIANESLKAAMALGQIDADKLHADSTAPSLSGRTLILGFTALAFLIALLAGIWTTMAITRPLKEMAAAAAGLSRGDLEQSVTLVCQDEIGQVAEAFRQIIGYQKEIAQIAEAIASGDLTPHIEPQCDRDVLGHAFSTMSANLRELIGEVSQNAEPVADTSVQLAASTEQAGSVSHEIAASIEEVSQSAAQSALTSQEMAQAGEQ